jgi:hypothetical protein
MQLRFEDVTRGVAANPHVNTYTIKVPNLNHDKAAVALEDVKLDNVTTTKET